jgi:hemoglobin-like flavoprotein
MNSRMNAVTKQQRRLVQESLPEIQELSGPIGQLFFGRLFEMDPSLRAMFHQDIALQSKKVMDVLTSVVARLDHFDEFEPEIRALGQRHTGYGVRPDHYDLLNNALIWALGRALDSEFYPELKAAWRAVLDSISVTMKEGAAEVSTK